MSYVIEPLSKSELLDFFDDVSKDVIKYFMIKALFSQPESLPGQKNLPVQVPKEHIEQWFTQALDVKPVGSGSYPIDIYNEKNQWGADIKMLSVHVDNNGNITGAESGEASLGQNFRDAGIDLDQLFDSKSFEIIKDRWVNLYKEKFDSVKSTYDVKYFYYFFILRTENNFYLVGAKINLDQIDTVKVNRNTKSSVYLSNFIADDLGNTKIYKAKKRLELRLRPKNWVDKGLAIKFTSNFNSINDNLRESIAEKDFIEKRFDQFKDLEINIE